jgi:hypothetical protein
MSGTATQILTTSILYLSGWGFGRALTEKSAKKEGHRLKVTVAHNMTFSRK